MDLTLQRIEKHISYLHNAISEKIELNELVCSIPRGMIKQMLKSSYSQESLQEASNFIAKYLKVNNAAIVEVANESILNPPAIKDSYNDAEKIGIYKVSSDGNYRTIKITTKVNINIYNVLAILSHENVHNFMFENSIRYSNEMENEILTDICCVYVGLGDYLAKGYTGIDIGDAVWEEFGEERIMFRWIKLGYINLAHIDDVIYLSSLYRNNLKLSSHLPLLSKISLRWNLFKRKNRHKTNIKINCIKCGTLYNIPKMIKGKKIMITCKKCSETFHHNY